MTRLHVRLAAAGFWLATVALAIVPPAAAQEQLTVERIFGSAEFYPQYLADLQWLPDGSRYTYLDYDPERQSVDLVAVDPRTGQRTRLIDGTTLVPEGQSRPIEIEGYEWSPDGSKLLIYTNAQRVWRLPTKGTYYIYELATRRLTPLSRAEGWQQFAKFSPDGRKVGFVRNNDIFVVDLATGAETRLTHDGSEVIINGTSDWVYEEELDVRDAWRWSPDGRRIAFWRFDQSPVRPFFLVNELPLYPELFTFRYPKAGTPNSQVRIGVVDVESGKTTWTDVEVAQDGYIARMEFAATPNELVVQRLNRHQNRLDVLLVDATTGRSRVLFTETDSAWVDVHDNLIWIRGGRQFLWTSERDGFNHLYLYNRDGSVARQLTRGPWEVTGVYGVDEANGWVYFQAAQPTPMERQIYRVRLDGSRMERLSAEPGWHDIDLSPDRRYYVDIYSRAGVPPVTRLHTANGRLVRELVNNQELASRLAAQRLRPPEFFRFRTSDGVELNGYFIKPPDFDASRKYPVLLYVYGGPGSQTVVDSWGGSRYLWHQLLAQRGVIVVSVDNRGTGGRGRAFKKVTYLNLGKWEVNDQIEAARYLASLPYVDPARIGIWGWSYGGYMTALTMTKGGDLFRAGISVAPVTDWRLYDTIYTERFMRTPEENPEGYRESAPVNHAAGLTGALLLVHGTADDNVHPQNTIQLANALQLAGKQFSLMLYPNRTHSISGGNTMVHLFTMMTDWVRQRL
ncbi:MAG TPA: S9 family peptidase [Longimicrobiales bacterium]